jgi:transposase
MTNKQKRKNHSAEFKSKVAIEAIKERQTLEEIAKKYEIHPVQLSKWKNEALSNFQLLFSKPKDKSSGIDSKELYAEIGKLKMEVDFLKKKL